MGRREAALAAIGAAVFVYLFTGYATETRPEKSKAVEWQNTAVASIQDNRGQQGRQGKSLTREQVQQNDIHHVLENAILKRAANKDIEKNSDGNAETTRRAMQQSLDNRGTNFLLGFLPNHNQPINVELHLTSDTVTNVTVEYPMNTPTFIKTVAVEPGEVQIVDLPSNAGMAWAANSIKQNVVRAYASNEFICYMINRKTATSDAALALPIDTWNTDYIVMDYSGLSSPFFPPVFVVVAAFDNTNVTITPTNTMRGGRSIGTPFAVILNKGEGYLGQSSSIKSLTGTTVDANRPVGLTNGVRCTNVPSDVRACDHIFEVAQPVQSWGSSIAVANLPQRPNGSIYRVLASEDNTTVALDGNFLAMLRRGQFHETSYLPGDHLFTGSKPIFVAQFMPGQNAPGANGGDPAMGNMIPTDQYQNSYTFSTVGDGQFEAHYVSIIAATSDVSSLVLDNTAVPSSDFLAISGTEFSAAVFPLEEGTHSTASINGHGITVQGYNSFDSYIYPGGALFGFINPTDDLIPPICSTKSTTDISVLGDAVDEKSILLIQLDGASANLELNVDTLFIPGDQTVLYNVSLIDPEVSGSGSVVVTDGGGNTCELVIEITIDGPSPQPPVGTSGYNCIGSCSVLQDCFQLTPEENERTGAVWSEQKLNLSQSFTVNATLNFGTKDDSGGEGMAFVLQINSTASLGGTGNALGFKEISPNLAVEFDTFKDIFEHCSGDCIRVTLRYACPPCEMGQECFPCAGKGFGEVSATPGGDNIEDGDNYEVQIHWDTISMEMSVFFNNTGPRFEQVVDLSALFGNSDVYWGFTAATGSSVNNAHTVCLSPYAATVTNPPKTPAPTAPPKSNNSPTTDAFCEAFPDPHFRTWNNVRYDYHGGCDVVLIHNALLKIHIRTQVMPRGWSSVSNAALRIGDDTLEVVDDGTYYVNGITPTSPPDFIGGVYPFAVTTTSYMVTLSGGQFVEVLRFHGTLLVRVSAHGSEFKDSVGMCSIWENVALIGRDGNTTFTDGTAFGEEWQVNTSIGDPDLFRVGNGNTCEQPTDSIEQPDSELVAKAEMLCANITEDELRNDCIFDIIATNGDPVWALNPVYTNPLQPPLPRCNATSNECLDLGGSCVWRCNEESSICKPDLCNGIGDITVFEEEEAKGASKAEGNEGTGKSKRSKSKKSKSAKSDKRRRIKKKKKKAKKEKTSQKSKLSTSSKGKSSKKSSKGKSSKKSKSAKSSKIDTSPPKTPPRLDHVVEGCSCALPK